MFGLRILLTGAVLTSTALADSGTDFFETRIRPVLVQNCYGCHSSKAAEQKKLRGGLLLDTRAGIRKGGESGPAVVPKDTEKSLLLSAIRHESFKMPPKGKLPKSLIADIEKWIKLGAPDPRDGKIAKASKSIDIEAGRRFWSFRPLGTRSPPSVNNTWARTDIDRFVFARLNNSGLRPSVDAEPRILARRLYFDLIGLPPTPAQVRQFIAAAGKDRSKAIEALVDRLLASRQFGERWGRHWLDVARYGETSGGTKNREWPDAWRYRNYVIDAFNADKPFNDFVEEQISGDLLPTSEDSGKHKSQTIATGFLAMGSKPANATRMEIIGEQLDVVGRAFMGISISCARCHDHKFDPVPTRDFYALAGIMRNVQIQDGKPFRDLNGDRTTAKKRNSAYKTFFRSLSTSTRKLWQARHRLTEITAKAGVRKKATEAWTEVVAKLSDGTRRKAEETLKQLAAAKQELEELRKAGVPDVLQAVAVADRPAKGRNYLNAKIHIRGSESNLGDEVPRGVMQVLTKDPVTIGERESGRRQLARVVKRHPLTARVAVNRIWHHLFGRGLVKTVDNFGTLGERPSHPELLEWLASRFVGDGWSVKKTIRRIVLSRTYQLSSDVAESHRKAAEADPENRLIWRHSVRRIDAESLRDAMLLASGRLRTERPDRFQTLVHFTLMTDLKAMDAIRYRAVYLPVHRGFITDVMAVFNFPPADLVIGRRETPSVPTQSLFLLNSPLVIEQSEFLADFLLKDKSLSEAERIDRAYEMTFGRLPSVVERREATEFIGKDPTTPKERWQAFGQALFCSAEFRFIR